MIETIVDIARQHNYITETLRIDADLPDKLLNIEAKGYRIDDLLVFSPQPDGAIEIYINETLLEQKLASRWIDEQ